MCVKCTCACACVCVCAYDYDYDFPIFPPATVFLPRARTRTRAKIWVRVKDERVQKARLEMWRWWKWVIDVGNVMYVRMYVIYIIREGEEMNAGFEGGAIATTTEGYCYCYSSWWHGKIRVFIRKNVRLHTCMHTCMEK